MLVMAIPFMSRSQELASHRGAVAEITVSRAGYVYRKMPCRFIFDTEGRVTSGIVTDRQDTCGMMSYRYDGDGRVVEKRYVTRHPASKVTTRYGYHYDEDGLQTRVMEENGDYRRSAFVAGRDGSGRDTAIIRETTIFRSGRTDCDTVLSSYDSAGRIVSKHTLKAGYGMRERFAYNNSGDVAEYVKMNFRTGDGSLADSVGIRYEYEYDTLGNWIRRRDTYNDGIRIRYTRSIVYR